MYGFARLTRGPDAGGYYHELFLRGKEFLCKHMIRTKVKGTMFKAASSPEHEPDFYQMPAVVVSPRNSDDEYANSPEYEVSNCNFDSTSSNIDPMSFQFAQQLPCEPPKLYYAQSPVVSQPTPSLPYSYGCGISIASDTDRILDEAVDELFLHQEDVDTLDEFVHDWDPSFEESSGFGSSIDDDSQLGYLLEKLLQG